MSMSFHTDAELAATDISHALRLKPSLVAFCECGPSNGLGRSLENVRIQILRCRAVAYELRPPLAVSAGG